MIKKYLRVQPAGIQLAFFLSLWAVFFLLFALVQPALIKYFLGVSSMPEHYEAQLLEHPLYMIYLNAVFSLFIFLLPAFLFAWITHQRPFAYAGLQKPLKNMQWPWAVLLALGLIPILTSIGGWIKELDLGHAARAIKERHEAVFNIYFKTGTVWGMFRNLLFLALVPAFCEEFFFRGVIQRFAYTWFKKPWAAILFSGAFFAFMHFTVYEFLPILFAGIILAWIYYITSSLWLSVLVHFLNNGLQVVLIFLSSRFPALEKINGHPSWVWGTFILAAGLFILAAKKIKKFQTPLPPEWSVEELPLSP
jgi:membrane protease YdiL (CAAX protease family)